MIPSTPLRPEETPPERRARQLDMFRELAELNMVAARDAAARIQQAGPEPAEAATATLSLARATRAVTQLIGAENRVASGDTLEPRRPLDDPRRDTLQKILNPLTRDPDPARSAARRRRVAEAIDDALDLGLDEDLPLAQIAVAIARTHGLPLDLATLPDELLGYTAHPANPFARAPP